ncbi:MAG TPA: CehA/McbA family metallohydrolase [Bryobacteraceae bacterium]|nr:CehA/McbA family metallohydrolase [Bryobacteraceae bacterium]
MHYTRVLILCCGLAAFAQQPAEHHHPMPATTVPLQPLTQQVRRLETALSFLGQPFSVADRKQIDEAIANPDESAAIHQLEQILDRYALAIVDINAESRVKVEPGPAKPELVEGGTRLFLVKVINDANVTAPLAVDSPNSGNVYIKSNGSPEPPMKLTPADAKNKWADISLYKDPPMSRRLSGLALEYVILAIESRDHGQREAEIGFNVGQGTEDIGYRNAIPIVFNALPARPITIHVTDENGKPSVASFVIRDRLNRIYPNQAKRLAPDFFFEPQIYRFDGETVDLPAGYYTVAYTGGPEYRTHTKELPVSANSPAEMSFQLDRWIDPAKYGWYSGDHHVHAAGCSHYQNPTEGVLPSDMIRQIRGEALNIGAVLTWGPCYYYQKQFFTGKDNPLSTPDRIMHYDLEVSGFPSSHAGHLVLLGLKEQDYPGTKRIEDWPSWDLPILRWGKSQGAVVGFAHSGWGLQVSGQTLPTDEMPAFDGIGANEYIVDVTYPNTVDFISSVDTPAIWELNIWYHTLNLGFRTRISGETDFPCIYDNRVGLGRSYVKIDGGLSFTGWLKGMQQGRSYVSDGYSHLMDFKVNGQDVGVNGSELDLSGPAKVHAEVRVAAWLDPIPNEALRKLPWDQKPYWNIERARIGDTRDVPVELIVNGKSVARKSVTADGQIRTVSFDEAIEKSSWIAVRILPSSHTNPIFTIVDGKPIRVSRRDAQWCLTAVRQCWTQKALATRESERAEAHAAYDHAHDVYQKLLAETPDE